MLRLSKIMVGALVLLGPHGAQATPFTPDMWVYEFAIAPSSISQGWESASTLAPAGTPVPAGCSSSVLSDEFQVPLPGGDIRITCDSVTSNALGIDVLGSDSASWLHGTFQVGFNESRFGCSFDGFGVAYFRPAFCPSSVTSTGPRTLSGLDFFDVSTDYATGEAAYSFSIHLVDEFGSSDFSLDPDWATMSGLWVFGGSGDWNYGYGGNWYVDDALVQVAGQGHLVSAPTAVPLPAPMLLLLSTFAVFIPGLRRRRITTTAPSDDQRAFI